MDTYYVYWSLVEKREIMSKFKSNKMELISDSKLNIGFSYLDTISKSPKFYEIDNKNTLQILIEN